MFGNPIKHNVGDSLYEYCRNYFLYKNGSIPSYICYNNVCADFQKEIAKIATLIAYEEEITFDKNKSQNDFDDYEADFSYGMDNKYLYELSILSQKVFLLLQKCKKLNISVYFHYDKSETKDNLTKFKKFLKKIEKNLVKTEKDQVYLLLTDKSGGLDLQNFKIKVPQIDIKLNYGARFGEKYDKIKENINKNENGIVILEGAPGTGKTSLIKYLISEIEGRDFIFVPSNLAENIDSPSFLKLLVSKPNSVIILEDAEKAIIKRGPDNSSLVSSILNLSDGIIGSVLNTFFIITYNTNTDSIDPAILRKGRLKYIHKFNKLTRQESQAKIDSLGIKHEAKEEMSLADIYNLESNNGMEEVKKEKIGF